MLAVITLILHCIGGAARCSRASLAHFAKMQAERPPEADKLAHLSKASLPARDLRPKKTAKVNGRRARNNDRKLFLFSMGNGFQENGFCSLDSDYTYRGDCCPKESHAQTYHDLPPYLRKGERNNTMKRIFFAIGVNLVFLSGMVAVTELNVRHAERIVADRPAEYERLTKENLEIRAEVARLRNERRIFVAQIKDLESSCEALYRHDQETSR